MSYSEEFQIDGVDYLLQSDCGYVNWKPLVQRVQKELIRIGKEAAKNMYGEAKAIGFTRMNGVLVSFKLVINPKGNTFNAS